MDKAVKVSIIAGVLIVSLSVVYYFVIFLPYKEEIHNLTKNTSQEIETIEEKKQSSLDFFSKIIVATDSHNFGEEYVLLVPESLKAYLTKDQYIAYKQGSDDGNQASEWLGGADIEDRDAFEWLKTHSDHVDASKVQKLLEQRLDAIYEYKDSKWQVPDPEPSERALVVSTKVVQNILPKMGKKERDDIIEKKSYGRSNTNLAIRIFALELDKDLQKLVFMENELVKLEGGTASGTTMYVPNSPSVTRQSSDSFFDEYKQKQQQQCQEDLNEYNVCMNEYNAEMAEYNTCLSENADPETRLKSYCGKPSNFCYKPTCAY